MDQKTIIQKTTDDLLEKLGVDGQAEIFDQKEPLEIKISGPDLGILVGFHGETLFAIQHILSLMIAKETGERKPILVEIGDWRVHRQEQLEQIAENAASQAKATGQPQVLPPLHAQERRLVHLILAEQPDITTESEGEGESRRVVVRATASVNEKS